MPEPEDDQHGSERTGGERRRGRPAGAGERGARRREVAGSDPPVNGGPDADRGGAPPRSTAPGRHRAAAAPGGHPSEARTATHGHGAGPDPLRGPEGSPWVRYERLREELGGDGLSRPSLPDLSALLAVLEGLRALVPREVSDQFTALLRELLLTLRALIDWYLERLEPDEREPQVEEIPIE